MKDLDKTDIYGQFITIKKQTEFERHVSFKDEHAEEVAILEAERINSKIKKGSGLFLDFGAVPEYEKALIYILIHKYGWVLERPYFIRNGKRIEDY